MKGCEVCERDGHRPHTGKWSERCKASHERAQENRRRYMAARPGYWREHRSKWNAAHPEYIREWRAANPEYMPEYNREYSATKAHGITRTIRDWMYESQDRACAGCLTPMEDMSLQVDHDHSCCPGARSCGRCVRGLVCQGCNNRDALAAIFAQRFGGAA